MGGEIEKPLNKKNLNDDLFKNGKTPKNKNKNNSNIKLQTEVINTNGKSKMASGTKLAKVETKPKRGGHLKKKIYISAKDKEDLNQERKVLELIHEKNPEKEDYNIIYDIISKHFFL